MSAQALLKAPEHRPLRQFIRRCGMNAARLNIETLFTFSTMKKPWLSLREAAENELVTALLTRLIANVIFKSFDEERQDGRWRLRIDADKRKALENFAGFLLDYHAHVITFNYDLLLENYVDAEQECRMRSGTPEHERQFHVGYSYGFPALTQYDGRILRSDKGLPDASMQFLKLHGSINWFAASGSGRHLTCDEILVMPVHSRASALRHYDLMFERQPLIVPPILDKSSALQSAAFNLIWARAARLVSLAETIVFIGYSLPPTDYYADFLFRHVPASAKVIIVDFVDSAGGDREQRTKRRAIRQRYRAVLGCRRNDATLASLPNDVEFHFDGAVDFCERLGPSLFRDR